MIDFEEFWKSITNEEQRDLQPKIVGSSLNADRHDLLGKVYMKEVCRFIWEEGRYEYSQGVAEVLAQYLVKGTLRLCSMQEYLYPTNKYLGESWLYSDFIGRSNIGYASYFAKSSLATFFADLVSYVGGQYNNGVYSHIVDFNLMLHIYIMKTRCMKNNTNLWNGVNLCECDDYAPATRMGFKVFRWQYNQQIVNETSSLLNMLINCLTIANSNEVNETSLGMLDNVALDIMSKRYVFDNIYNVVKPDLMWLDNHNKKILREFERRSYGHGRAQGSMPKLRVYLCSSYSSKYTIIKYLAYVYRASFVEMLSLLAPLTGWEDKSTITSKIAGVTAVIAKRWTESFEKRLDIAVEAFEYAEKLGKLGFLDTEFYDLCKQYYIPGMEFVVYTWNNHIFEPVASEVKIDFKHVLEVGGDNWKSYLTQLYQAGQKVNILRRRKVWDKEKYNRITVEHVPVSYGLEVDELLHKETKKIRNRFSGKFNYMYTLDNSEQLEEARTSDKRKRDRHLQKYRKHMTVNYYPSGLVYRRKGFKVSRWRVTRGAGLGRLKIVKEMNKPATYFKPKNVERFGDDNEEI